MFQAGAE